MGKITQFRLLLVDDEPSVLNALRRLLRRAHYEVFVANSGEEAITFLEKHDVHVIISDMKMPRMSGTELLSRVADRWPDTVRVCLTGHADMQDTIDVINTAGIFRYVAKPWDDEELLEIVGGACEAFQRKVSRYAELQQASSRNKDLERENANLSVKVDRAKSKLESAYEGEKRLRLERAQAEKLNEAKTRFLASVSHEMRSPLNAIISMNALLLKSDLNEDQKGLAKLVEEGGQTLLTLINDVLDFSKIEANKLDLNLQWFNFIEVLNNIVDLMSSQTINKPVEVVSIIAPGTPRFVFGDKQRIRQIVFNIIGNAIKFTEKGGVCVKVSPSSDGVNVNVQDTGIGISEHDLEHIFEDFFQADNSSTRNYGGTGLGLSICKNLANVMGGSIDVSSKVGVGSEFSVSLPLNGRDPVEYANAALQEDMVFLDTSNDFLFIAVREQLKYLGYELVGFGSDLGGDYTDESWILLNDIENRGLVLDEYLGDLEKRLKRYSCQLEFPPKEVVGVVSADLVGEVPKLKELGYKSFLKKPLRIEQVMESLSWSGVNKRSVLAKEWDKDCRSEVSKKPRCLKNKTLLLVEDSPVNQAVVKAILDDDGYDIDIANNGVEAVSQTDIKKYDLILMDLSMPLMDGVTATETIRASFGINHDTTIIAMTANAFAEDKERCLASGMNDYLTKPIDVDQFLSCLARWLGNSKNPSEEVAEEYDCTTIRQTLPDNVSVINTDTLVRLIKDTSIEVLPKILGIYYEETEKRVRKMLDDFDQENWGSLRDEAHTLKSSSGSFGAHKLYDLARDIEVDIKQGMYLKLEEYIQELPGLVEKSIEQLKSFYLKQVE